MTYFSAVVCREDHSQEEKIALLLHAFYFNSKATGPISPDLTLPIHQNWFIAPSKLAPAMKNGISIIGYSAPHLSAGDAFPDSQWISEPVDSHKPYKYYVWGYQCMPMIRFNF